MYMCVHICVCTSMLVVGYYMLPVNCVCYNESSAFQQSNFQHLLELTKCCRESSHSQLLLVILPDLKCFPSPSYPLFTVLISVYRMILSFSLPTARLLCMVLNGFCLDNYNATSF